LKIQATYGRQLEAHSYTHTGFTLSKYIIIDIDHIS
jgi:hypothetical protein